MNNLCIKCLYTLNDKESEISLVFPAGDFPTFEEIQKEVESHVNDSVKITYMEWTYQRN